MVPGGESRGEGRRERRGCVHTGLASCHSPSCQWLRGPVLNLEEQLCEPGSSWHSASLTWGPEEKPGPCSLLPPLPLLQLARGRVQGWNLSGKGMTAWPPTQPCGLRAPVHRRGLSCLAQGHLALLWALCPSQPSVADKAWAEGGSHTHTHLLRSQVQP